MKKKDFLKSKVVFKKVLKKTKNPTLVLKMDEGKKIKSMYFNS